MRDHISRPYFVPDNIPSDNGAERLDRSFSKVFLGPAGTVTRLHNDTYHTHAWLSQIRGSKQFILYAPSDAHNLHCGEGVYSDKGSAQTWFDPLNPDYDKFPRARKATPYIAVCGPGDTILVPGDWLHYAVALTPSITLMRNFMNDANERRFMEVWNEDQEKRNKQIPRAEPPPMAALPQPAPLLPPPRKGQAEATPRGALAPPPPPRHYSESDGSYLPSASFAGARTGFVFRAGPCGVGYYRDGDGAAPKASGSDVSGPVHLWLSTTLDGSREVIRHPDGIGGGRVSGVARAGGSGARDGRALHSVEPFDAPCGRREVTAWRWSEPRRASAA